jgi:hypothetical protein
MQGHIPGAAREEGSLHRRIGRIDSGSHPASPRRRHSAQSAPPPTNQICGTPAWALFTNEARSRVERDRLPDRSARGS